jgi:hypothetical protein
MSRYLKGLIIIGVLVVICAPFVYGQRANPITITTPEPTATSIQEPLQVITYTVKPSSGALILSGVLTNTSSSGRQDVRVVATVFDASDAVIGVGKYNLAALNEALPHYIYPFEIYVSDVASQPSRIAFDIQSAPLTTGSYAPYTHLKITNTSIQQSGTRRIVRGTVTNTGTHEAARPVIIAIAYLNKSVLDVDYTSAPVSTIAPGESSPFEITLNAGADATITIIADALAK